MDVFLDLFVALVKELMQLVKFCTFNNKMMLLVLQVQSLETAKATLSPSQTGVCCGQAIFDGLRNKVQPWVPLF